MNLDSRFIRQQDAVDMRKLSSLKVTLIGAGSIGSTMAPWLGKMGITDLTVYDDDLVEEHNWSNQLYTEADIGRPKVEALWDQMERLCSFTPRASAHRYTDEPLTEVVINAVDSMSSRKAIWHSVKKQPQVQLYIDARMGLETLIVHSVSRLSRDYAKSLHSDSAGLQEPCTARTICYTPLMASSVICNLVKRYVNNEDIPEQIVMDLATYTTLRL